MQQDNSLITCCLWLSRLAWINVCWWLMTLAGLVITGVIPASVVALKMMRRYLNGKNQVCFHDFVVEWKNEWRQSNFTLLPLILTTVFLLWLFTLVGVSHVSNLVAVLLLSTLPLALVISLFCVAVLLELSVWSCSAKQGWINGLLLLQQNFGLVIITALCIGFTGTIFLLKPICGVFFLFSPVALISMVCMMKIRPHLFEENK